MLLTTIGKEKVDVAPVDIDFLTSHNIIGVKSLLGPSALFQLDEASAKAVRAAIEPGRLALGAVEQLQAAAQQRDKLYNALREVRHALQFANENPHGGISDTLWMMHDPETVFDYIDRQLAESAT